MNLPAPGNIVLDLTQEVLAVVWALVYIAKSCNVVMILKVLLARPLMANDQSKLLALVLSELSR